jgi:hypothetical protein
MQMAGQPKKKVISESYAHQINVLKTLSADGTCPPPRQLSEIAERSGLKDEKEVLRYLYILEGQKLVSPQPEGDFTSKTWCITKDGVRALGLVSQSTVQ